MLSSAVFSALCSHRLRVEFLRRYYNELETNPSLIGVESAVKTQNLCALPAKPTLYRAEEHQKYQCLKHCARERHIYNFFNPAYRFPKTKKDNGYKITRN